MHRISTLFGLAVLLAGSGIAQAETTPVPDAEVTAFGVSAAETFLNYKGPSDAEAWAERVKAVTAAHTQADMLDVIERSGNKFATFTVARRDDPVTSLVSPDTWLVQFNVNGTAEAWSNRNPYNLKVSAYVIRTEDGLKLRNVLAQ